ncbi:MAG: acryloyl-CoA reductase [Planctomycetota bacterium]|nr:MAG: acryloyl-CoA reductase [Planctomycetota bacterium]
MDALPPRIQGLVVTSEGDRTRMQLQEIPSEQLPPGDVVIRVAYSSINYKDALATQGHPGIVKRLPHVPGIDAAGIVERSQDARYRPGDQVIVTGYDLGQGRWGAWAELISVPADWIVPLPSGLDLREAMILGTAGFTAAQCVLALQRNEVTPGDGRLVVTGATGGVGSLSVRILAQLGYEVAAVTGKAHLADRLRSAGAVEILDREAVADASDRPMLSARWAGGVDCVGGRPLMTLLRSTKYGGAVAACGLVAGAELHMTVYPFLLRGVSLCGVASADCPYARRVKIWQLLAGEWKPRDLADFWVTEIGLEQVPTYVDRMLQGKADGRIIVRLPGAPAAS